jgi:nicotinate-nucleotide pyrophosphorylase (carboxylating)
LKAFAIKQMLFLYIEVKMRLDDLILQALEEDLGNGDITTGYLDLERTNTVAWMIAKAEGMVAGVDIAIRVFKLLDSELKLTVYRKDGDLVKPGEEILRVEGNPSSILKAERTSLNFLQRLSGIATKTHSLVRLIADTDTKILDTRKTTPLLRRLEKYAVRVGGGYNHRTGLYDMILLKENHIRAARGITEAIRRVRLHNTTYKIEVEVTNLKELDEAVKAGVDRVMLDNMDVKDIKKAVKKYKGKVELEVSGGINEANIVQYAGTGVDYISIGALTHSVKALDISLLFKE